jgi:hypothetical protein
MNGMKLNPEPVSEAAPARPVLWGDIDHYIEQGRKLQAETIARALSTAGRTLKRPAALFNSMEWARNPAELGVGPVPWGDLDRHLQDGRRLQAQAVATSVFAAMGLLKHWVGTSSPEARAQAAAERAARRKAAAEQQGDITRGFFWPRLSWVAHEGGRWLGFGGKPEEQDKGKRAA